MLKSTYPEETHGHHPIFLISPKIPMISTFQTSQRRTYSIQTVREVFLRARVKLDAANPNTVVDAKWNAETLGSQIPWMFDDASIAQLRPF